MATTARGHRYRLAMGKQSGQGSAQATAEYEFSLYSGAIKPQLVENEYPVTDTDDLPLGYYASRGDSMGTFEINSDLEAVGFVWTGHLGTDTKTGAGDPYSHTITKADAKAYHTIYQMRPDIVGGTDVWERGIDHFIKAVEMRATKGEPLRHYVETIGTDHRFTVSAPTITNNRKIKAAANGTPSTANEELSMIGSTLKLDLDATPATTTVTNIESITLRSEYASAEWIQTNDLNPAYLSLGPYRVGCTVTMVFGSFASYNSTFFGDASPTGDTDISPVLTTGAAIFDFSILPTVDLTNNLLEFQLPSLRWVATLPDAQPSGEAVRVTLTAKVQKPASGEVFTVLNKNARSTAYS